VPPLAYSTRQAHKGFSWPLKLDSHEPDSNALAKSSRHVCLEPLLGLHSAIYGPDKQLPMLRLGRPRPFLSRWNWE